MKLPFEGAQRTKWKTQDKVLFFRRLLSLFPQVEPMDLITIEKNLYNPDAYFEIAHYDESISKEDPSIIFLLDQKELYIDFMHPFRMRRQLNMIEMLLQNCGKMVSQRDLTQQDFVERLMILEESTDLYPG